MTAELRVHLWNMRFYALHQALANKLYHQRCASIFERRDRFSKLFSLIGSSAVFMSISSGEISKLWALVAFSGACASLVFRWSEKARSSSERMMQYASIQVDIQRVGEFDFTEEQIRNWNAQISAISEPSPNSILWARACHFAEGALGCKDVVPLSFWQRNMPVFAIH